MFVEGVDELGNIGAAGVSKARLNTNAISTASTVFAVSDGRAFTLYTRKMTITGTARQIILYLVNDNDNDLIATTATVSSSESVGGDNNQLLIEQIGGIEDTDPIVVAAVPASVSNRNLGSPAKYKGNVFVGPAAETGEEVAGTGSIGDFTTPAVFPITTQIPRGGVIGIAVTPPANNTSIDLYISIATHVKESLK